MGIGGIGMSAIARYYLHQGYNVAGYDKTPTQITNDLIQMGAFIHYEDSHHLIPSDYRNKETTMVIYTPAIPDSSDELNYFNCCDFKIIKRSRALGVLSKGKFLMAVSGTHGKTSTSTMLAYFNHVSTFGCGSAFLGGISRNYNSNLLLGKGDRLTVEADEFDRSFLQLYPDIALVTSTDADHLDIYENHDSLKNTFTDFINQIKPNGVLIYRYGIDLVIKNDKIKCYTYSLNELSDFRAEGIVSNADGTYCFDIVCPDRVIANCCLGAIGLINIENCIGAVAMLWSAGDFDELKLKEAIRSFKGVQRRLELHDNSSNIVYIDDYAHHPKELSSSIYSIRDIFPNRKLTVVFQPHLYTRTRDFATEFAESLSLCDEVILLPIYPARELPISGVDSKMIMDKITTQVNLIDECLLVDYLKDLTLDILVTFGAGSIGFHSGEIVDMLNMRTN